MYYILHFANETFTRGETLAALVIANKEDNGMIYQNEILEKNFPDDNLISLYKHFFYIPSNNSD